MNEILKSFNDYFEVVSVNTPQLREQAYKLRYQVYCHEEKIPDFDVENYPDGLETDVYDQRAVQCLLLHRPSKSYIGTVRLILCDQHNSETLFPLEKHTGPYFDPKFVTCTSLPRQHMAEISRLCVIKQFRLRNHESNTLYGNVNSREFDNDDRRHFPHPFLGLLVAVMRMTAQHNITHWYAGMEPTLNKRLSRFGLHLSPIGPKTNYHGQRQPHLGIVGQVMDNIYFKHHDVWELLTEKGAIWPAPENKLLQLVVK